MHRFLLALLGPLLACLPPTVRARIYRFRALIRRSKYARSGGYPDWQRALNASTDIWTRTCTDDHGKAKVLIATSVGAHLPSVAMESTLAVALKLRGAQVHVLLCDGVLPACMDCEYRWFPTKDLQDSFIHSGPGHLCRHCFSPAAEMFRSLGVTVHRYSDYLADEDKAMSSAIESSLDAAQIRDFTHEGLTIGEHAYAGALRFFARGDLVDEPNGVAVLRVYLRAALLTAIVARRLLKQHRYECAVFNHGIYVPQGIIGACARASDIRVVNWNPGYRRGCFIFSHSDTYHHTMMTEPVSVWENMRWTSEADAQITDYLRSRWTGAMDWIWFHDRPMFGIEDIERELGIDLSRQTIGMLTNVIWDAQLHYPANAFSNMLEWITITIDYFAGRPDLQLLIRVHPAEIRGTLPSRQCVVDEICRLYPSLPRNVFIIRPESRLSTYAAMAQCDSVLIYGTKTGVELTGMGVPAIVAGEAWIRNKGITIDVTSRDEYLATLDTLPLGKRLASDIIHRARRYAYHFFFRRMIPLEFMQDVQALPRFRPETENLEPYLPGSSKGLDVICQGILDGSDFIYPAEQLAQS